MTKDEELRLAAESLLNPIVWEVNGKRITMGIKTSDFFSQPHTPEDCPVTVVVENLKPEETKEL